MNRYYIVQAFRTIGPDGGTSCRTEDGALNLLSALQLQPGERAEARKIIESTDGAKHVAVVATASVSADGIHTWHVVGKKPYRRANCPPVP
jgi:hypothetical protein